MALTELQGFKVQLEHAENKACLGLRALKVLRATKAIPESKAQQDWMA